MSEFFGVLALVASIVGTIVNWIHTNRVFEQSNYPFPELRLILEAYAHDSSQTGFHLILINPDSSKSSIRDTEITIYLRNFLRSWRFWNREWLLYGRKKCRDTAPGKSQYIFFDEQGSLEAFLVSRFPKQLLEEVQPSSMNPLRYRPTTTQPIHMLCKIRYTPSILGSKKTSLPKFYLLVPNEQGFGYDIEEVS
jgi:hypothetical protein